MNGLRVTKNIKEIKFEAMWGPVRTKKLSPETITYAISETNSIFHVK